MESQQIQQALTDFLVPILERSIAIAIEKRLSLSTSVGSSKTEILSAQEAADFIGVSLATLYGLTSARKIPHAKRGKRLYFDRQELTAWILEGKRKSAQETENEAADYIAAARYNKIKKH